MRGRAVCRAAVARSCDAFRPSRARRAAASGASGQATLEALGVLPLLVAIVLAAVQLLAAGAAHELADGSAEAGAAALLQGLDPEDAARDALPGWSRSRVSVTVSDSRVTVRVRPREVIPGAASRLTAVAVAEAGESLRRDDPDEGDPERTERIEPLGASAVKRR